MTTRRIVGLLGSLGAIAAILSVYYQYEAHRTSPAAARPQLFVYQTEGNEEVYYSSLSVKSDSLKRVKGKSVFLLPLKIINEGTGDAKNTTIWLKAKGAYLRLPDSWTIERYAGEEWGVNEVALVSPDAAVKLHNVGILVDPGTREVTLPWMTFPASAPPSEGKLVIRFDASR